MQSSEIELKFPVTDPEALQTRLPQLGYQLVTPRTFEHNTLYDTVSRDLRARKQILRLRQYGNLCTVTHKRQPDQQDPVDTTRYKIRIETETIVAEREALGEIFQQLGYAPAFIYEKYRTEWSHSSGPDDEITAHLVIDETPIGTYAELEGPTNWIDKTLVELNIDPDTCLTDSYGKLFLDWKQRTGSLAEHLTFTEITSPLLSLR
ncbi:class IV adenylate cyclase [Granulicella sp. S190]|uniref:class IV adenylate cyclase n=1 Tax=Granulicella sp. S190 TaxID=1747226 RepID=UPI00131D9A89|nr:class IV adenylate cyclase [Granulicella sp. S190]